MFHDHQKLNLLLLQYLFSLLKMFDDKFCINVDDKNIRGVQISW